MDKKNAYIFPFLWMRGEEEDIIRTEIGKICECGIDAVCVEARPHDDFCGPKWWHDMDIVLDEAKKRGMKVWILDDKHFPTGYANGLIAQHPERKKQYLACSAADVFGAPRQLTLNVRRMLKPAIGYWEIGNPVDMEERANNRLLALIALRFAEGDVFSGDSIDLTDTCKDGVAAFTLPEGQWRVHALYITRTDGGNPEYINMIDRISAHTQIEGVYEAHYARYADEFGRTIAGFFSDEPQFGNITEQCFDTKLGKPKMPLPWSEELADLLRGRYPQGFQKYLPLLFAKSADRQTEAQIRYDYMDCISKLYAQNFSRPIGEWCKAHGVEYIGHVVEDNGVHSRLGLGAAHWFRAMEGQDMAGIDMIGGQYYFGAPHEQRKAMTDCDGEFFHYALGKLGASAGHLDPKKKGRTMCELFGATGWDFGVRDMKYLLDHLLSRGVNRLVPHAFSMAEYPDPDCPPHFYARGHNPEFPYFAKLMKYAGRMCGRLSGGTHAASVAVLYDGELDWTGDALPMQKICRALTEHQIDYDIVCLDMLRHLPAYDGAIADGRLVINGVTFGALLVPGAEAVPEGLIDFAKEAAGFPVYFVERRPEILLRDEGGAPQDMSFMKMLPLIPLAGLADTLVENGMRKISVQPAFAQLSFYHYEADGQMYFFMNESADRAFDGTVTLPSKRPLVYDDAMADRCEAAAAEMTEEGQRVKLSLAPGESCLLRECDDASSYPVHRSFKEQREGLSEHMDLSAGWRVTCMRADGTAAACACGAAEPENEGGALRSDGTTAASAGGALRPVSDTDPAFSGIIRYEREVVLDKDAAGAVFVAEHVEDVCRMEVNGRPVGILLTPPYQFDLKDALKRGSNRLVVEVATTPARDQANYPAAPFDFSYEAVAATGMYGKVQLLYAAAAEKDR